MKIVKMFLAFLLFAFGFMLLVSEPMAEKYYFVLLAVTKLLAVILLILFANVLKKYADEIEE